MNYALTPTVHFTGRKESHFVLYRHVYRREWEVVERIEMAQHVVQRWAVVGGVTILLSRHFDGKFLIT
jgi:hypothetical protein